MSEIPDESIQLIVTSPPYFNAPFDYPDLFKDYDEFLELIRDLSHDLYRVLAPGRVTCFVTDDMLVGGESIQSSLTSPGSCLMRDFDIVIGSCGSNPRATYE
jgi:DNA modification methylase